MMRHTERALAAQQWAGGVPFRCNLHHFRAQRVLLFRRGVDCFATYSLACFFPHFFPPTWSGRRARASVHGNASSCKLGHHGVSRRVGCTLLYRHPLTSLLSHSLELSARTPASPVAHRRGPGALRVHQSHLASHLASHHRTSAVLGGSCLSPPPLYHFASFEVLARGAQGTTHHLGASERAHGALDFA
jgi:hypothetical protein